jgi:hypothetical protein
VDPAKRSELSVADGLRLAPELVPKLFMNLFFLS